MYAESVQTSRMSGTVIKTRSVEQMIPKSLYLFDKNFHTLQKYGNMKRSTYNPKRVNDDVTH